MDNQIDKKFFEINNIEYFSKKLEDLNEFKNLYFFRAFKFFQALERFHPKEYEEFLKVF